MLYISLFREQYIINTRYFFVYITLIRALNFKMTVIHNNTLINYTKNLILYSASFVATSQLNKAAFAYFDAW